MTLTDRVALVTGAKRIGLVVACELASRGADVAISYNRSTDEAQEAVRRIEALGRRALALRADLTTPAECRRLVDEVATAWGRLDVLVNMASVRAEAV